MKKSKLIAAAYLIFAGCTLVGPAMGATETPAQTRTTIPSQQPDAQFKQSAMKFVQSAQAYLAITSMKWQTFMTNPSAYAVPEILKANADYQSLVARQFSELMELPGKSEGPSEKLKDFYAAWGLAFQSMRPTSADTGRGFSARTNSEMNRMDALAARLQMDLQ